MTKNVFDYIKSINEQKKLDFDATIYNNYVVCRNFGYFPDTVFLANELNCLGSVDADQHYEFLFNSISKRKRYAKWIKEDKDEDLELVAEYFSINKDTAKIYLKLLDETKMKQIREYFITGGTKND